MSYYHIPLISLYYPKLSPLIILNRKDAVLHCGLLNFFNKSAGSWFWMMQYLGVNSTENLSQRFSTVQYSTITGKRALADYKSGTTRLQSLRKTSSGGRRKLSFVSAVRRDTHLVYLKEFTQLDDLWRTLEVLQELDPALRDTPSLPDVYQAGPCLHHNAGCSD